jgi:hypothetical protein
MRLSATSPRAARHKFPQSRCTRSLQHQLALHLLQATREVRQRSLALVQLLTPSRQLLCQTLCRCEDKKINTSPCVHCTTLHPPITTWLSKSPDVSSPVLESKLGSGSSSRLPEQARALLLAVMRLDTSSSRSAMRPQSSRLSVWHCRRSVQNASRSWSVLPLHPDPHPYHGEPHCTQQHHPPQQPHRAIISIMACRHKTHLSLASSSCTALLAAPHTPASLRMASARCTQTAAPPLSPSRAAAAPP